MHKAVAAASVAEAGDAHALRDSDARVDGASASSTALAEDRTGATANLHCTPGMKVQEEQLHRFPLGTLQPAAAAIP